MFVPKPVEDMKGYDSLSISQAGYKSSKKSNNNLKSQASPINFPKANINIDQNNNQSLFNRQSSGQSSFSPGYSIKMAAI